MAGVPPRYPGYAYAPAPPNASYAPAPAYYPPLPSYPAAPGPPGLPRGPRPNPGNPGKPSITLYIRNLPYQMTVEEFTAAFQEFGQICTAITNHIHDRGIAFVTYFDIRSALRAVEKMQTFETRGRKPVTGFAYHSPDASGLNPRDLTLSIVITPVQPTPRPHPDVVRQALTKYGEVQTVTEQVPGQFAIDFFDLRAARAAVAESGKIVVAGMVYTAEPVVERQPPQAQPPPVPPPPQYQQMFPQMQYQGYQPVPGYVPMQPMPMQPQAIPGMQIPQAAVPAVPMQQIPAPPAQPDIQDSVMRLKAVLLGKGH